MDLIGTPENENPLMYLKRRVTSFINLLVGTTYSNVAIHPLPNSQKEPYISIYQSALKHLNALPKPELTDNCVLPPNGACQIFLDSLHWVPPTSHSRQEGLSTVSASCTALTPSSSVQDQTARTAPVPSRASKVNLKKMQKRSISQCNISAHHHDGQRQHAHKRERSTTGTIPVQHSASDHKHAGANRDSSKSPRQRSRAPDTYRNASICHLCTSDRLSRLDEDDSDPPAGPVPLMPFATPCSSSKSQENALIGRPNEHSLVVQHYCSPTPSNCNIACSLNPAAGYHRQQPLPATPSYCQCCLPPPATTIQPIPVPVMTPYPYNCYCCFPAPMTAPSCTCCAMKGDTNKPVQFQKDPVSSTPSDKDPQNTTASREKRKKKKKHHQAQKPAQTFEGESLRSMLSLERPDNGAYDQQNGSQVEAEAPITFLKEDKGMCSPNACNKLRSVYCTPGTRLWEHYMPILEFLQCKEYKELTSDITVFVQGQEFNAHKMILMTYSTYFRDYLCHRHLASVDISCLGISESGFQSALEWMYSTQLTLSEDNIGPVWTAANGLGIKKLSKICKRYLRKLVQCKGKEALNKLVGEHQMLKTCNLIVNSSSYECLPEIVTCKKSVCAMLKSGEYKNWTMDQLNCVLTDDDINIKSEKEVFDLAVAWLNCQCPVRPAHVVCVMSCVRFPLMTRCELMQCFSQPANKFLWKQKECLSMLLVAYMATSSNKKCCLLKESTCPSIVQPRTALNCVC